MVGIVTKGWRSHLSERHTVLNRGTFEPPVGWEARLRVDILEPRQSTVGLPVAGATIKPPPRANVIMIRSVTDRSDLAALAREFVTAATAGLLGAKIISGREYVFDDDNVGHAVTVTFSRPDGLPVAQGYVFRLDGDILTQFTATVGRAEIDRLDGDLGAVIRGFSPSG